MPTGGSISGKKAHVLKGVAKWVACMPRLPAPHAVVYIYQRMTYVQAVETAVRKLNDLGVFTVFVILDSLFKVNT